MISLIITLIVLILFIIITIYGINSFLFSVVDKFVSKNENFENYNQHNQLIQHNQIPNMDSCKKLDNISRNIVNTQTGTNIPLNPIQYNDHIGQLNIYNDKKNDELKQGKFCANQNELLYDGIWKSDMNNLQNGFLNQSWELTNGNVINNYVCSDKFIQTNKTLPDDYIDCTTTPDLKEEDTTIYFNDKKDDPLDLQINCFPEEFNKGITPNTRNFI
jgi:hypothetical protein